MKCNLMSDRFCVKCGNVSGWFHSYFHKLSKTEYLCDDCGQDFKFNAIKKWNDNRLKKLEAKK